MSEPPNDPRYDPLFSESLSEDQAFLDDLKKAYENPEIYGTNVPQLFKLRILSYLLPGFPTLIETELNGDLLRDNLAEFALYMMSLNPDPSTILEMTGDKDFSEFARNFEQDPIYPRWREEQWKFFLRHFPKLLIAAHHIAAMSAFLGTMLMLYREEPDEQLNEIEKLARQALEREIASLEKIIKQIVATRSSGRPKKYECGELPEIVTQVLRTAHAMMGDARGKDAVPGLAAVALKLNTSEDALGRRLRLAKHPWTQLRDFLAKLPSDINEE